jgi:hypothetical protein
VTAKSGMLIANIKIIVKMVRSALAIMMIVKVNSVNKNWAIPLVSMSTHH